MVVLLMMSVRGALRVGGASAAGGTIPVVRVGGNLAS